MRPPDDLIRMNKVLDDQLGSPGYQAEDPLVAARREAKALLGDERYRRVLAVMRSAGTAEAVYEPMLGPPLGGATASEYAMYRVGAAALWQMLVRLAQEADHEPVQ